MQRHAAFIANPLKKLISAITVRDTLTALMCYMLSRASVFGGITPFGLAFFAVSFSNTGWFYALIGTVIGTFTVHSSPDSLRYIITLGFVTAILGLADNRHKKLFKALVLSLVYITVCFFMQTAYGFLLYEFIVQAFEGFLSFISVYAMASVVPVIMTYKKRTFLSHGEVVGIISVAAVIVVSLASVPAVFGLNIASCIALFLIMSVSYRGDILISSCAGIIFGIALALSGEGSAALVGAYAIVGFAAGFFSRYSRLGTVLGATLANAVIVAFMNDTAGMLINPIEVFIVGMTFAMLPKKTAAAFTDFATKAAQTGAYRFCGEEHMKTAREEKLLHMSESFEKISEIYRRDCFLRKPGKQYTARLFDYICEKGCSGCVRHFDCWSKNRQKTLACLNSMINTAGEKSCTVSGDLPEYFKDNCVKKKELLNSFNSVYDIYKTDKLWLEKIYETRVLMSNQMKGISAILKKTSEEGCFFINREYEMNLRSALDSEEIAFENINVLVKDDELKKIRIVCAEQTDTDALLSIAEDVFDMKLCLCRCYGRNTGFCCEMSPAGEYIIDSASVYTCREGETVCGDSFGFFYAGEKAVMAISDGMGSGMTAHRQSKDTVEMLECFLEAGYDSEIAFELINSSLLLRSMKDCFSTVDMMCADTDTGEIIFSKIGAAPSYIKHNGGILRIDCNSLPVGILREVDAEITVVQVREHATIVMISDGISNSEIKNGENWIENELARLDTHNPAVVAEKILEKAIAKNGGIAEDDMTVAVAVVYKNEYKGKNYIY